jgi:hypothetical protein
VRLVSLMRSSTVTENDLCWRDLFCVHRTRLAAAVSLIGRRATLYGCTPRHFEALPAASEWPNLDKRLRLLHGIS